MVRAGPIDASADAVDAADDTGSNATSSDALLLTVLQRLRRATQATAVQRALVATGRVAHGAASRKNETVTPTPATHSILTVLKAGETS